MCRAGVVRVVGERHQDGRPGRGVRLYAASEPSEAPGPQPGASRAAQRVRDAVEAFAAVADFSATDVARETGLPRETVRLILNRLQQSGIVCEVVEIQPREIGARGRPAKLWTSNAENMAIQRFFIERLNELTSGES